MQVLSITSVQKNRNRNIWYPWQRAEKIGAFGLTEPSAGTDSSMQQTTAVLDGDEYVLNGTKVFITNAGYADIYVVIAMTDKSKGNKGISAFIVEKAHPASPLVRRKEKWVFAVLQPAI